MTHANKAPWFTKAGAATSIIPISHFVGASIFALKGRRIRMPLLSGRDRPREPHR